jgi:hypothetical protein
MKGLFGIGSRGNGVSSPSSLRASSLLTVAQHLCTLPWDGSDYDGNPRSNLVQASTTSSPAAPPVKKDPQTPQITPLEKRLQDMGPIRVDGSDKFFGMENVSVLAVSVIYTR